VLIVEGEGNVEGVDAVRAFARDRHRSRISRADDDRTSSIRDVEAVVRELLEMGEFRAVDRLLEHPGLPWDSDVGRERLSQDVGQARHQLQTEVQARWGTIDVRRGRFRGTNIELGCTLDEVLEAGIQRASAAKTMLAAAEAALAQAEAQWALDLQGRMKGDVPRSLASIAQQCIESGFLDVAEALLSSEASPDEELAPLVPRVSWPHGDRDAREVLGWLLGKEPAPAGFGRWLPKRDDDASLRLMDALWHVVRSGVHVGEQDLDALREALAAWLLGDESQLLVFDADAGCVRLKGLHRPGFPRLARASEAGIPLLVPVPGAPVQPATVECEGLALCLVVPGALAATGTSTNGDATVDVLRFDAHTVFPLLAQSAEGRLVNFLRALGAQLPKERAIVAPGPNRIGVVPSASAAELFGRTKELNAALADKVSIVAGAAGIGTSTILARASADARRRGDRVIKVPLDARFVRSELAPRIRELGTEDRVFLAVDDLHLAPDVAGIPDLLRSITELVAACSCEARCVIAARLSAKWQLEATGQPFAVRVVAALPHGEARRLVATQLDYLGVVVDPPALIDRIAFLSGGHPTILSLLLQELLGGASTSAAAGDLVLRDEDLQRAWRDSGFRSRAAEVLLATLEEHAFLRVILVAMLLEAGSSQERGITRPDLEAWVEQIADGLVGDVETGIRRLTEAGLVEGVEPHSWAFPRSGIGALVAAAVPNPLEWGERAILDARRRVADH